MKLKYVGKFPKIHLLIANPEGGRGRGVAQNEVFECTPQEAAELLARNNAPGERPLFVSSDDPLFAEVTAQTVRRGRPPKEKDAPTPDKVKMAEPTFRK